MEANNSLYFERALVNMVVSLAADQDLNFAQFARKAYGQRYGNETAVTKWRKQRREESPQQVSISDAYLLALGLGLDFPDLVFRVQAALRIKQGNKK